MRMPELLRKRARVANPNRRHPSIKILSMWRGEIEPGTGATQPPPLGTISELHTPQSMQTRCRMLEQVTRARTASRHNDSLSRRKLKKTKRYIEMQIWGTGSKRSRATPLRVCARQAATFPIVSSGILANTLRNHHRHMHLVEPPRRSSRHSMWSKLYTCYRTTNRDSPLPPCREEEQQQDLLPHPSSSCLVPSFRNSLVLPSVSASLSLASSLARKAWFGNSSSSSSSCTVSTIISFSCVSLLNAALA